MHKGPALAKLQIEASAFGLCVQKTAEAEAMVAGGVYSVFTSNEVIAPAKLASLTALAKIAAAHNGQLAIAVDSIDGVIRLVEAMAAAQAKTTWQP